MVHDFAFPREIAPRGSHLNDFQVSPDGSKIYIADASIFALRPAIVVYDVLSSGATSYLALAQELMSRNGSGQKTAEATR